MKLIYRIAIRLSVALTIVLVLWGTLFYITILDEINDEVNDLLEDYSEQIIIRFLAGDELPSISSNSNDEYYLKEVTYEYAQSKAHITYKDSMVYIPHRRETEPARILTTIFKDGEGKYYELVMLTPTIEKHDLKIAILYWVIFLYVGLLLIILLINIWVHQRSNRPLYKLLDWLDQYKVGRKNISLKNDTDITEFKKLNEVAIRNMQRAEQIFEEQKQFIGNASHEIQTPLAVCLNRLENLMEDETLGENQLGELEKIHSTLQYITKLNKTLLLLSKIDNHQFVDINDIELNRIIKKLITDYEEVYLYMNIDVQLNETGVFTIQMNETLATILINNLIKNAYVHNIENGKIRIEISPSGIVFKNTGQEFPLNPKLIFERFYQGNKKSGSLGLGLALVKSICEKQGLTINYYFEDSFHCFEISF